LPVSLPVSSDAESRTDADGSSLADPEQPRVVATTRQAIAMRSVLGVENVL